MVSSCWEVRGCPASLYLSKNCPFQGGKSCWETETGCPHNNQCLHACNVCSYFPQELKEKQANT